MSKKKKSKKLVNTHHLPLNDEDQSLLDDYLAQLNNRLVLAWKQKNKLQHDFLRAIEEYLAMGLSLTSSLARLDLKNLGGFYTRPPVAYFTLDDSSKAYPTGINQDQFPSFRLAATLKKAIIPSILQMALTFTIKRFPLFATTLKKGVFWHYLDSSKKRYAIEKETEPPFRAMKMSLSGSQCFRVLYYQNRISVEFFHVLTDGMGGLIFLKTLIGEYFRLLGYSITYDEQTLNPNDPPRIDETENEFAKIKSKKATGFKNKPSLQLSGALTKFRPSQILHFHLDGLKLREVSKKYQTTVTGYLLSLMLLASAASIEEKAGNVTFQVPVSLRKFFAPQTLGNFTLFATLGLPIQEIKHKEEVISKINQQLLEKTTQEKMEEMIYGTAKLVRNIRFIPLIIKSPLVKIIMRILGEGTFSSIFSNLGVISLPKEIEGEVIDFDFLLGPKYINRLTVGSVTVNNIAKISINKQTLDASFEEHLYSLLVEDGLEIEVTGSEVYESQKRLSPKK